LPSKTTGIAICCIGVGVVYPMLRIPSVKCSLKLKSWKVKQLKISPKIQNLLEIR